MAPSSLYLRDTKTTAEGRFSFAPVEAGIYEGGAHADGHVEVQDATVTVTPDGRAEITLELVPAAVISGLVVDPKGKPVSKVVLTAFPARQHAADVLEA